MQDRKGAVGCAAAGTIGLLFVLLAAGWTGAVLMLALGHSAFRMSQARRFAP